MSNGITELKKSVCSPDLDSPKEEIQMFVKCIDNYLNAPTPVDKVGIAIPKKGTVKKEKVDNTIEL